MADDKTIVKFDPKRRLRLTTSDLAKLLKVSAPKIRSFVDKGMPHYKRGAVTYFDLREAIDWWRTHQVKTLEDYKLGQAAEQQSGRELIDLNALIKEWHFIDSELANMYTDTQDMDGRFFDENIHLLKQPGKIDESHWQLRNFLDSNREKTINVGVRILESRRSGIESMMKKVLPDLKRVEKDKSDSKSDADKALEEMIKAGRTF